MHCFVKFFIFLVDDNPRSGLSISRMFRSTFFISLFLRVNFHQSYELVVVNGVGLETYTQASIINAKLTKARQPESLVSYGVLSISLSRYLCLPSI